MFILELTKVLGHPVKSPWSAAAGPSSPPEHGNAEGVSSGVAQSVEKQHDLVVQAASLGFRVDTIVQEKADPSVLWQIKSIQGQTVKLVETCDGNCT